MPKKLLPSLFLLTILVIVKVVYSGLSTPKATPNAASRIDLNNTHGNYLGFGIGIHPGDVLYAETFDQLQLEFVRMELGPLWYAVDERIPHDATVDELYQYIERNYNGDAPGRLAGAKYTYQFLREREVKIVLVHFEIPYHWRIDKSSGQLREEYIDDLARFYTAHLRFLKQQGIKIDYIELANEPDGHWNGHIAPRDYASLVQMCDRLFADNNLEDVKILGPGLAFLNLYGKTPAYMAALKNGAFKSLDGWSAHTWDEVEFLSSNPEYSYGVWQPFIDGIIALDPKRSKPLFLTEYGSDVTQFGETIYASPRDKITENLTDSWDYAVRVMANSISHLNRGVQALILYRLSNSHWHKTGWGIIQPETKTSYRKKPIYHAVQNFMQHLPLKAQILKPTWYSKEDAVLCSLLNNVEEQELTVLAVNWTNQTQTKQLVTQAIRLGEISKKTGLQETGTFRPNAVIQIDKTTMTINLPPQSIASFIVKYTAD